MTEEERLTAREALNEEIEACAKLVEKMEAEGDWMFNGEESYWEPDLPATLAAAAARIRARKRTD